MPPKKKSKVSPSDDNLAAQFKEGELTKESLLSYVRCVARDPACIAFPAYNYPKHKTMVLKVLMSMYVGPEIGKKKRKLYDNRKRPCSPSLFREASSGLSFDTSNKVPGSPPRVSERGRRKEERAGPSRRLEEYLSFVSNTYYSMPKQVDSTTESGSSSSTAINNTSITAYTNSKLNSTVLSIGDLFPMQDGEEGNNEDAETEGGEKAARNDCSKNEKRSLIPGRNEIAGLTLQRQTTLGILKNPARPRQVLDEWAPKQVALFEAAICIYGKNFHAIQKVVETKTLKQVIEFYYLWKKSSHYTIWKRHFVS